MEFLISERSKIYGNVKFLQTYEKISHGMSLQILKWCILDSKKWSVVHNLVRSPKKELQTFRNSENQKQTGFFTA